MTGKQSPFSSRTRAFQELLQFLPQSMAEPHDDVLDLVKMPNSIGAMGVGGDDWDDDDDDDDDGGVLPGEGEGGLVGNGELGGSENGQQGVAGDDDDDDADDDDDDDEDDDDDDVMQTGVDGGDNAASSR